MRPARAGALSEEVDALIRVYFTVRRDTAEPEVLGSAAEVAPKAQALGA